MGIFNRIMQTSVNLKFTIHKRASSLLFYRGNEGLVYCMNQSLMAGPERQDRSIEAGEQILSKLLNPKPRQTARAFLSPVPLVQEVIW